MKDKKDLKIVFMGTPEFAVGQLDALLNEGYNVATVVTVPDRPAGRGKRLTPSAVKVYAEARGIPVLCPEKLRDEGFLAQLREINADMFVVVAFRMLPQVVWDMPPMGTFNLHASLLPQYRGAAPINWAIINGEKQTGVTTFLLDKDIDTGNILLQKSIDILPEDCFGTMYEKLMNLGRSTVIDTVEMLRSDNANALAQQTDGNEKHAPKIFKEDCLLHWEESAENIVNRVRGLSPIPCAYSVLCHSGSESPVKIYEARVSDIPSAGTPGALLVQGKKLYVAASDFYVEILQLKAEGKRQMRSVDFLNGFRMTGDERFL